MPETRSSTQEAMNGGCQAQSVETVAKELGCNDAQDFHLAMHHKLTAATDASHQ